MAKRRKRILIINCYFPELREPVKRRFEVPDSLAPVLLAGHFSPEHCEVRLYNEVTSGFIEVFEPGLLSWPDMVVMTGLTATFDRLLHITAYVKTANPMAIAVAGGHAVRSLPRYADRFLDYTCTGDVEQIREVIRDALGPACIASEFQPRYDLAYWIKLFGYAEATRNCNFRCSFCSLTGAGRKYAPQGIEYLETQMEAMGRHGVFFFNDNQAMGDSQAAFRERLERVQRRREAGQFKYWAGFVTEAFFWDEGNITMARETGCLGLFVGVEAFDNRMWFKSVNKKQNARMNQVDLIRKCLEGGVVFQYGLVYDPTIQTLKDMHRQLDLICDHPEIPAPNFIFMAIPFPGTPFFQDRLAKGLILPNTHVRDLEASTLSLRPVDPVEEVLHFVRNARNFRGYRRRFLGHQARFLWHYRNSLNIHQMLLSVATAGAILTSGSLFSPGAAFTRKRPRTHLSTTERLDPVYSPRLPVAAPYRSWFEPTRITDEAGELNPALEDDALATRYRRSAQNAIKVAAPA